MTGDSRIPRTPLAPPAPGTLDDKADLRQALLAARRALDPADKARRDTQIGARVLDWWRRQADAGAAVLGVYWPLRGEPDLAPAYAQLAGSGVRLVLPVVLARGTALGFAEWRPGEAMEKDAMGVAVPAAARMAAPPDALLVPCLGFNEGGYRLGYGGGYYDRTLATLPRPATAGIAYACQAVHFAVLPHDVALDVVLTDA